MINRFGNDIHHILHVYGIRLRHEGSARARAMDGASSGVRGLPSGVVLVTKPLEDMGLVCPFVRP